MPGQKAAQIELATIQLNHTCNIPKATGIPGDIIAVPPELAQKLIDRGGAVAVISTEEKADPEPTDNKPKGDSK